MLTLNRTTVRIGAQPRDKERAIRQVGALLVNAVNRVERSQLDAGGQGVSVAAALARSSTPSRPEPFARAAFVRPSRSIMC